MEKEKPHALEMGKEEAQAIEEENEAKSGRVVGTVRIYWLSNRKDKNNTNHLHQGRLRSPEGQVFPSIC